MNALGILQAAKERGLSTYAIERITGIHHNTIQRYLRGSKMISKNMLKIEDRKDILLGTSPKDHYSPINILLRKNNRLLEIPTLESICSECMHFVLAAFEDDIENGDRWWEDAILNVRKDDTLIRKLQKLVIKWGLKHEY